MEEPIVLNGELSVEDVRRAFRLANRSRSKWGWLVLAYVVAFVAAVVALGVSSWRYGPSIALRFLGAAAIVLLLVGVTVGRHLWAISRLHKAHREKRGFFQPQETTITSEGMSSRIEGADTSFQWSFFSGYRHSGDVLLLYHPSGWLFLARSRFPSEKTWREFVLFIRDNLSAK